MTTGFVLACLPVVGMLSGAILSAASRRADADVMTTLQTAVQRAADLLTRPDWQMSLRRFGRDLSSKKSGLSILVLDARGRVVWRSRGPAPRLPWDQLSQTPGLLEKVVNNSNPPGIAIWDRESAPGSVEGVVKTGRSPAFAMPPTSPPSLPYPWLHGERNAVPTKPFQPSTGEPTPLEKLILNARSRWRFVMQRVVVNEDETPPAAENTGDPKKPARDYRVIAVMPRSGFLSSEGGHAHDVLAGAAALLMVVAGGAWLLVGRVLSPIQRLADQAAAASTQDLKVRLSAPSRDAEVVRLVGTLNGFLSRIAQTAAVRGRFYAAASHELRTPLQALSGHLEVALSRERSAEDYRSALKEAHRQTLRLTRLTTDLLLLNRVESGLPEQKETVDLGDVVEAALRQYRRQLEDRHLSCTTDLDGGLQVLAPPTHIEILVRNLVENAIKYTTPSGHLRVALTERRSLVVCNDCEWNPSDDADQVLEPFYRPDASRSARTGGNGLGLAICRAIVQANGWRMVLHSASGGICAVVEFDTEPGERIPGRNWSEK